MPAAAESPSVPSPPSPFAFTLNLFLAAAGAGLLSYPFATQQQGLLLCLTSTLVFAALTIATDLVLIQTAALFRPELKARPTFDGLCAAALGDRVGLQTGIIVVIGTLGGLIGYFIVLGDVLLSPLRAALHCEGGGAPPSFPCAWLATRALLVPLLAVAVVLPLASLPSMKLLAHSSALGAATVFLVAGVVLAKGGGAAAAGGLTVVGSAFCAPGEDGASSIVLSRWAFTPFMLGIPISIFSLGNQCQVVPLYLEAPVGSAASKGVLRCILAAVATCVVLYTATGAAGYTAFRLTTKGDVLLNLGSDAASVAAQATLAVHILMAFPVMMFPGREALRSAARGWAAGMEERGGGRGAAAFALAVLRATAATPFGAASVLVLSTAAASVLFPQVAVVFGLVGATVATYECHFLPGLMLLQWARALEGRGEGGWRRAEALWGAGREGDGARLLGDGEGRRGEEEEEEEKQQQQRHNLLPRFLSTNNPKLMRMQGWGLVVTSLFVMLVGTGAYVYQTWIQ